VHSDLLHKHYNGSYCEVYIHFSTISNECYEVYKHYALTEMKMWSTATMCLLYLTGVNISLKCWVYSVLHILRSSHRIIFSHTVLSSPQLLLTMLWCYLVCLVHFRVVLLTTELKPYEDSVNVYVLVSQEILVS